MDKIKPPNFLKRIIKEFFSKDFINYSGVSIFISVLNIILLWLLIDIIDIPTIISTTLVVGGTFVLRYFLYKFKNII